MRHSAQLALFFLVSLSGFPLAAQEPTRAEVVKKAKAATALVEAHGKLRQGSAFCIHDSGYFLTNQHVVGIDGEVKLILHPGLKDKKIVAARVVRADKELDLALLKVDDKTSLTSLSLGTCEGLDETTEVMAAGFPFGTSLALEQGEYPAISVNMGRVTALRMKNGELERVQTDAAVNPGNSGGPLLDMKGKVIGVVVSGVRGTAVNFAIPVSLVRSFVDVPEIHVVIPAIAYAERFGRAEFLVRAGSVVNPVDASFQVELRLGGKSKFRRLPMTFKDGAYRAVTEVVRPASLLVATVSYRDGRVEGVVQDRKFTVGGRTLKLSEVRTLLFAPAPCAVLADGKTMTGAVIGLDELSVSVGDVSFPVNVGKAVELTIEPATGDAKVEYTVTVRKETKEVGQAHGFIGFKGAPGGSIVATDELKKFEGLWTLDREDENGGRWPIAADEGVLIEGKQLRWVKENGKVLPGSPRAEISINPSKKPMALDIKLPTGTWLAICKIEGNRLTIATNCNDERRPVQFTTNLSAGPERATFVRVYKLKPRSDGD